MFVGDTAKHQILSVSMCVFIQAANSGPGRNVQLPVSAKVAPLLLCPYVVGGRVSSGLFL